MDFIIGVLTEDTIKQTGFHNLIIFAEILHYASVIDSISKLFPSNKQDRPAGLQHHRRGEFDPHSQEHHGLQGIPQGLRLCGSGS